CCPIDGSRNRPTNNLALQDGIAGRLLLFCIFVKIQANEEARGHDYVTSTETQIFKSGRQ
ncbi:hypothetical protein, partial [Paraburkholderia sp. SIMBA_027]|uniref:hypothetical protein n=1 Tax=Paraburkholderia sp. SIMBA_027 TaxID=3085770 RepID=UPI00397C3450